MTNLKPHLSYARPLLAVICLFTVLLTSLPVFAAAPDLTRWTDDLGQWVITGTAKVKSNLGGVPETNPPSGYDDFIFLSNIGGPSAAMRMDFDIPADAGTAPVQFDYQFVSDKHPNNGPSSNFYDVATATLDTPNGQQLEILHQESRDAGVSGLSWPRLRRLFGFSDPDLPSFDRKVGGSGWHPVSFTIDPAVHGSGTYSLTIAVIDKDSGGIGSAFLLATETAEDLEKNLGCRQDMHGNPCNAAIGSKFQAHIDYQGAGPFPLLFTRAYNSRGARSGLLGAKWQSNLERRLIADSGHIDTVNQVELVRTDGRVISFHYDRDAQRFRPDPDIRADLRVGTAADGTLLNWVYAENDHDEEYDAAGRLTRELTRAGLHHTYDYQNGELVSVSDQFGRSLTFTYHPGGLLKSLTDPDGNRFEYGYQGDLLQRVTLAQTHPPGHYLEGTLRQYHYEDTRFPQHLTGITDENAKRFATWTYDDQGLAASSEHAGGAERLTFEYPATNQTRITNAKGDVRLHTYSVQHGMKQLTRIDANLPDLGAVFSTFSYNAEGYLEDQRDFDGTLTHFEYNDRGLERLRVEAAGSPVERTITTEWHPVFDLPVLITTALTQIRLEYDAATGALDKRTVTDRASGATRITDINNNAWGLPELIDGPGEALTQFTYGPIDGTLKSTANAFGHNTTVLRSDASGRPLEIRDPNGLVTLTTYDPRGRLERIDVGGRVSTYTYTPAGDPQVTHLSTGEVITRAYDDARRLRSTTSNRAYSTHYQRDALGNPDLTTLKNGAQTVQVIDATYDAIGRLRRLDGDQVHSEFTYDAGGRRASLTDGRGYTTEYGYDALGRLTRTTDADRNIAERLYDSADHLLSVSDFNGNVTTYGYDGLDNLRGRHSPDTGVTAFVPDEAGNVLEETRADAGVILRSYDQRNRLYLVDYPGTESDIRFTYDERANGLGRRTGLQDATGATEWDYNPHGQVSAVRTRFTALGATYGQGFAYHSGSGLPASRTLPSGRLIHYDYDPTGRLIAVSAEDGNGIHSLARDIRYYPTGLIESFTYGNGLSFARTLDSDARLDTQSVTLHQDLQWSYDPAGNIDAIADLLDPHFDQGFGYDPIDRLIQATSDPGYYDLIDLDYDPNSNRTYQADAAKTHDYQIDPGSNRLEAIDGQPLYTYSPLGSLITDSTPGRSYGYNDANRLHSVTQDGQVIGSYQYNGLGQRVVKSTDQGDRYFLYDIDERLLAELDHTGAVVKEYVYLQGEPLAMFVNE